ncbi:alpha-hydroxy acid oxidase [Macromonas nakdongensis]|uniref:alpha-hydroxy acid oxidase n=1 Tax=Macromonas nakdongensis TaxID=1843082 RepID=UPI000C32CBC0|nr:alpha-hydroxy acid oxidase [Macromonas nakdongensis]
MKWGQEPLNIGEWRTLARRRLPKFVFDYVDGAAEDGLTLRANRQAFEATQLKPRVLRDTSAIDTSVCVFGRNWRLPIGVAPMGLNGLVRPGGDLALARAAAAAGIPFVLSTASNERLERVRQDLPDAELWLQLYVMQDPSITDQLLRRAKANRFDTLVLTVDVPVSGLREQDLRNGFRLPFRLTPKLLADLVCHPGWSLRQAVAGQPKFVNLVEEVGRALSAQAQAALLARAMDRGLNWARLDQIRQSWPGKLVVKGVLHPEDASLAVKAGVDGIVVSNHGGRQLDGGVSSINALPALVRAVSGCIPVFLDSGVRRGVDVIKAMSLGATSVFVGRPLLYGLAAQGEDGARRVLSTLGEELQRAMTLMGAADLHDVDGATAHAGNFQS